MGDIARHVGRDRVPSFAVVAGSLAVGTLGVAVLESVGVADASSTFLLSVVAVAVLLGTRPALAAAIGAFLIYDVLFIEPRYTLTVADPQEWLNLLLLLVVGLVVGRLAGQARDRALAAEAREREARALFSMSFALATSRSTPDAYPAILAALHADQPEARIWIQIGETVVADTGGTGGPSRPAIHTVLSRRPGDQPAEWTRVHLASSDNRERASRQASRAEREPFRVNIGTPERTMGSIWVERVAGEGAPDPGQTRVVAAAADQIGRALERDRLAEDAAAAEIARRSDVIKSALLDSVSHDLRTPLASIRTAAGTLMDPTIEWSPEERREIAAGIDLEADRLNHLVTNLLDMSRIEAGQLRPRSSPFVVADLVAAVVRDAARQLTGRTVGVDIPETLPPVHVDDVLFSQALGNVIENAAKYAGPTATIRISASRRGDLVVIEVDDDGPGVPDASLPRLFEKFYRVPRRGEGARRGTGMGLAVVRGVLRAMGGDAEARRSPLGGLSLRLMVPVAALPGEGLPSSGGGLTP